MKSRRTLRKAKRNLGGAEAAKEKISSETQATKKNRTGYRLPKAQSEAILIKPAEGKTFAQVLGEIRSKANPEATGTEIRSVRRSRSGGVLLELGSKTLNKAGFCETLRGVLGDSAAVYRL